MIRKISFENYKAFEKGEIKLKPITILLGANSVGKSSIINLLLMLQQTANSNTYKSALRLHGENISMGECENIFRNRDTSRNISIEFEFESDRLKDVLKKDLFEELVSQIFQPMEFLSRFPPEEIEKEVQVDINQFVNSRREIDSKIYKSKEQFLKLLETTKLLYEHSELIKSDIFKYYIRRSKITLDNTRTIDLLYDFLKNTQEIINGNQFNLFIELCYVESSKREKVIKIKEIKLKQGEHVILDVIFEQIRGKYSYNSVSIETELLPMESPKELLDENAKEEFLKLINYEATIFSWLPSTKKPMDFFLDFRQEDKSIATNLILKIIDISLSSVKSNFTRELINHISPLRAHPKRFYFLDKANINTVLDTLDGDSLTEILKENNTIKENVNNWLSKFGLKVDVSTIQDVVHQLKIHQHTLDLDITDVGFGISQILPIIVQGFLSFKGSLTMVEQPEIHLHPKMQAELADLFIDIVNRKVEPQRKKQKDLDNGQKYLLIETHSEYLLKRLMRRINEKVIASDQVAVYFIEPPKEEGQPALIIEKEISEEGSFEWPKDFYEGEVALDNCNFIKMLYR